MGEHIEDLKGRTKEAVGDATGNKDLQREGKVDQASASAKGHIEDAKDKVEDLVDSVKDRVSDIFKK